MERFLIGLLAVTTTCPTFAAQQTVAEVKLVPSQGGEYEHFGTSISADGVYVIVGAPAPLPAEKGGSAFVYKREGQTLVEQARLVKPGGEEMDLFGRSVAISGDYAVVGVPGHDIGRGIDNGAAFVYRRDGENWARQAMLVAGDPGGGDEFGYSVGIDGDYIIVGAQHGDVNGCAYVFMRNGEEWAQQAKLSGGGGPHADRFGYSVAIDGPYAIVGDPEDVQNGAGSAYVFVRDGTSWSPQARLSSADGEPMDMFGAAVAIDGNRAVVGAPEQDCKEPFSAEAGVGHIFGRDGTGWTEVAALRAAEPEDIDIPSFYAGASVSISGNRVVLGAIGGVGPSAGELTFTGTAYLYEGAGGNWEGVQKLIPNDGIEGGNFGCAAAVSGDLIIVGSTHTHPLAHESGAAYAYGVKTVEREPAGPPKIAVEPLEDHVFWKDDGGFDLTIRHDGYEGGTQGIGERVAVEVTVNKPDEFLEGDLVTDVFELSNGEEKQFRVDVVDLLHLIRNFEKDVLFGANVQIRAWPEDKPGTVIFDDEFNIYRYLDAADETHDDRSMSMAPTLRDGPDEAIRKREVELWAVHEEAETEFEIDSDEFRVEATEELATFTFDPSAGEKTDHSTEEIQVRNKTKDRVAGTLFIEGMGRPTHRVFLNRLELVATLGTIANWQAPEYHLHSALLTDDETAMLRPEDTRWQISEEVEARMKTLLGPVSSAVEFIDTPGDPKTTIRVSWPTRLNGPRANPGPEVVSQKFWSERIGKTPPADGKVTHHRPGPFGHAMGGVDNAAAIYEQLANREEYSRAELHYRLATRTNMNVGGDIEVYVDSILESAGIGEPLTLSRQQLVNAIAKTALHELGHDLGLLHTAAMGRADLPSGKLEQQRITWNEGTPGSKIILGFNGAETAPLPRSATAAEIGYALRGLDTIWGPNIGIPKKRPIEEGYPRWVEARFCIIFNGVDVPLLTIRRADGVTGGTGPDDPFGIHVEPETEGQVGAPVYIGGGRARQLVYGRPDQTMGDTDIMTGGMNDIGGKLIFQPDLSLMGLRIGLGLSYDTEDIENHALVLEQHHRIALNTKGEDGQPGRGVAWDSAD